MIQLFMPVDYVEKGGKLNEIMYRIIKRAHFRTIKSDIIT